MDMPLNTLTLAQSGALRRILDRVASGRDALAAGDDDGHALLDAAAEQLAALRQRAIRVSVPPAGLSLSGLMAAITGRPNLAAQDDAVLELGFRMLTVRDDACDGIVLLVSGADRLHRPALRYIQFACRAGRDLRVVLAGAGVEDALAAPELAALRTRLAGDAAVAPAALKPVAAAPALPALPEPPPVQPMFVEPPPTTPVPVSAAPAPVVSVIHAARVRPAVSARTDAPGKSRRAAWAAGLGLAASLALGLWVARSPSHPANEQAAVAPAAPAMPASVPAPPGVAAAPPTGPVPAPAAAPSLAASPEPATPFQEAMPLPPPVAVPPAALPRAAFRRPDTRAREAGPVQSIARRPAPAQPRFAQSPPAPAPLEEERYPAPPRSLRTEDTFGPMYSTLAQPRSFIGTYSANPDGTRAFRMEP